MSTFEVAPQISPTVQTTPLARTRNMKPCRNCADMHKKCNISPPYSSGNCEVCNTARVPCPPHKGRKPREKVTRARLEQNSPLLGSVSDVLQPYLPSDNKVVETIQPQAISTVAAPTTSTVSEPSSDDTAADILLPEQAFMYNVPAPASQNIGGFDGVIFPDESFELSNIFTSGREDWLDFEGHAH